MSLLGPASTRNEPALTVTVVRPPGKYSLPVMPVRTSAAAVLALQSPGGDGRVVHGAIEREIELGVPLQPVEDGPRAADAQIRRELIRHCVGDEVPVTRWRL